MKIEDFHRFRNPKTLYDLATRSQSLFSDEDFFNSGDERIQKIKEALIVATFILGCRIFGDGALIRMRHDQLLDCEIRSPQGDIYPFEITTSYEPGRKIGLEYREGRRPQLLSKALSGVPIAPESVALCIRNKTEKAKKMMPQPLRHLLVYQNISGGALISSG